MAVEHYLVVRNHVQKRLQPPAQCGLHHAGKTHLHRATPPGRSGNEVMASPGNRTQSAWRISLPTTTNAPVTTCSAGNLKLQRHWLNSAGVFWIDACSRQRPLSISHGLINYNCSRQPGVWRIVMAMTQNSAADCDINSSADTTPIEAACASGMGGSFRPLKRHRPSSPVSRPLRQRPG